MRQIMRQLRIMPIVFVAVLALYQRSLAAEHPVDVQHSTIRIHVGKAGLFSAAAGHEHWVTAPIASGAVEEDEPRHISFTVQAKSITVEPDKDLKPEQHDEVQRTMQDKVLESAQYPEISFRSSSVQRTGEDTFVVKGELALHGQVHPVSATVHRRGNAYVGTSQFKQTTFGIHPVSVGGVVKVKDELEIQFSVVPASGETE